MISLNLLNFIHSAQFLRRKKRPKLAFWLFFANETDHLHFLAYIFSKIQYDKDNEDDKGDEDDGDEENEWSAKPITALSNDSGRSRGTKLQVRPLGKISLFR